jgi:hypothetical protein
LGLSHRPVRRVRPQRPARGALAEDTRFWVRLVSLERKHTAHVVRNDGGAADCLRLGMKRVLLSLLIGAAVSATPTTLHLTRALNLEGDDAMSMAITRNGSPSSPTCVQSTEMMTPQADQNEVHSVVVDMPQVISLTYAAPETWGDLPMPVRPYEQPPERGPVTQLTMR